MASMTVQEKHVGLKQLYSELVTVICACNDVLSKSVSLEEIVLFIVSETILFGGQHTRNNNKCIDSVENSTLPRRLTIKFFIFPLGCL